MNVPRVVAGSGGGAIDLVGRFIIYAAFVASLLIVLLTVLLRPGYTPLIALLVASLGIALLLFRYPLLNLAFILSVSALVSGYEEGFQLTELVFGVYYLAFLGHWFVSRGFLYGERVLDRPEDKAIAAFLFVTAVSIPISFFFGAPPKAVASEWMAILMLGLYFPIKEACIRYKQGGRVIVGVLLWLGLFAAVRNIYLYREALSNAEYAWQIISGRVWMNDALLMVTSITAASLFIHSRSVKNRVLLGFIFLAQFGGLILTQSRAMWVSFAIGCFLTFLLLDQKHRKQLLLIGLAAFGFVGAIALLFFGKYLDLIFLSFTDRLASLATALSEDVSLLNRFYESKAVLAKIIKNPVIGYGMGIPYRFHDITHMATTEKAFVHNGYIGLWYKFGIVGLGTMIIFWVLSLWRGLSHFLAMRSASNSSVYGLLAAVSLTILLISANTSNPFYLGDTTMMFAILTGLACGVHERHRLVLDSPGPDFQ